MKFSFLPTSKRRRRSNRSSVVANLDEKILRPIFQYVSSSIRGDEEKRHREMAALCHVCLGWSRIAQEVLYERVSARSLAGVRALHLYLAEHEDLCNEVKAMEIPPVWIASDHSGVPVDGWRKHS